MTAVTGCPENPKTTYFLKNHPEIVSEKWAILWIFPKWVVLGVFWTTGDRGRIFFSDYGYSMDTLNSQIHFEIGDSSFKVIVFFDINSRFF